MKPRRWWRIWSMRARDKARWTFARRPAGRPCLLARAVGAGRHGDCGRPARPSPALGARAARTDANGKCRRCWRSMQRARFPFRRQFARILVDAPCSGTGTLARNPEIRWRLQPQDLADAHVRQTAMLRQALALLAPGGRLVYATCSLEPEENEQVVREALSGGCAGSRGRRRGRVVAAPSPGSSGSEPVRSRWFLPHVPARVGNRRFFRGSARTKPLNAWGRRLESETCRGLDCWHCDETTICQHRDFLLDHFDRRDGAAAGVRVERSP